MGISRKYSPKLLTINVSARQDWYNKEKKNVETNGKIQQEIN